jgi:hypothetical protein
MIRESRVLRAFVLTAWMYALLLWLYIAVRIITYDYILFDPFVWAVPWLSFAELGAFAFIVSSALMFIYLYLWGFGRSWKRNYGH